MRVIAAAGLCALGAANLVWLNVDLLPAAIASSRADNPEAVARAGLIPDLRQSPRQTERLPPPPGAVRTNATSNDPGAEQPPPPDDDLPIILPDEDGIGFEPVRFRTGAARISREGADELTRLAALLAARPELAVELRGHSDHRGSSRANVRVSRRRAAAARRFLIGRGVAANRVVARGLGSREPLRSGHHADALSANRRVEIELHLAGEAR